MEHFVENKNADYTREQIKILKGREINWLTTRERLDFANAGGKPLAAAKDEVPPAYRFNINLDTLLDAYPLTRLRVANGAEQMGRMRQQIDELNTQLAATDDAGERQGLNTELGRLKDRAIFLYGEIGQYELKKSH